MMEQVNEPSRALKLWRDSGALRVLLPPLESVSPLALRTLEAAEPLLGESAWLAWYQRGLILHWAGRSEDALVWLKGRHQVKFGYRLVDRRPSPMIHDNTRSLINFGTSFVNNPVTNSGGTGLAAVLLGYFNNASRGFLLEVPHFRVVESRVACFGHAPVS